MTTGKIYHTVITKEREGAYLGKTVQIAPHITDEIKRRMLLLGKTGDYDVIITEVGGTVGDIESQPFIEAMRQLRNIPSRNCRPWASIPTSSCAGRRRNSPRNSGTRSHSSATSSQAM